MKTNFTRYILGMVLCVALFTGCENDEESYRYDICRYRWTSELEDDLGVYGTQRLQFYDDFTGTELITIGNTTYRNTFYWDWNQDDYTHIIIKYRNINDEFEMIDIEINGNEMWAYINGVDIYFWGD